MRSTRTVATVSAVLTAALLLAACGDDSASDEADSPAPAAAVGDASASPSGGDSAVTLAGDCPETVVLQTDWNPESEHGGIYHMLGPDPDIDAGKKMVTGPLVASGKDTGVKLQVRSGGPAIGFQTVTSQMYLDKDITLGYTSTDESAQLSVSQPTIAVAAPLNKSPQIIMWDPASHPEFTSIADIGKTDTKVRYFQGAAYMEYFTGTGILKKSQVDGSYDGTPASFVAARGKDAQQGFASAEPYIYENEVAAWGRPVAFQLINDAGYEIYQSQIGIRADDLETLSPCLTKLVPIIQQAQIDYVADPAAVNTLVLELVEQYNTGWQYSDGVAKFSVKQQLELGLVANGTDGVLGSIDEARVKKVLDIVTPIFAERGTPVKDGLTAGDLFTNEFLDTSLSLP